MSSVASLSSACAGGARGGGKWLGGDTWDLTDADGGDVGPSWLGDVGSSGGVRDLHGGGLDHWHVVDWLVDADLVGSSGEVGESDHGAVVLASVSSVSAVTAGTARAVAAAVGGDVLGGEDGGE